MELKHTLEGTPKAVPTDDTSDAIIFDLPTYYRKAPMKKLKLITYDDL